MDCCNNEPQPMSHMHGGHNHGSHIKKETCHGVSKDHHTHGSSGMSHGSAKDFLRRFFIVTILLVPLVLTNEAIAHFIHVPVWGLSRWIQFALATVIFGFSLIFFQHAWHEIKMKAYGMMTLVSLAVGAGYIFSVASTFIPTLHVEFYPEIGTLIWVLLFGHYLEARSGSAAGNALSEVAKLLPKKAHRIVGDTEEDVEVMELNVNDIIVVKPGEKIPADGEVVYGASYVNESLVSGESKPIEKKVGSSVIAGTIVVEGALKITLTRVGEHSTIGQIQKLIASAQHTKPSSQRLADRVSKWLTFISLGTAIITMLVWSLVIGAPFVFAITLAITVLVITCPHALGLAIPTVTTIATSLSVKNGIFFKNLAKIETIRKANYVVFDKTGTLTQGVFGVTSVTTFGDKTKDDILKIAASLEQSSSHIIGQSIVTAAKKQKMSLEVVSDFKNIAGKGIVGKIANIEYVIGNKALIRERGFEMPENNTTLKGVTFGKTLVYIADRSGVIGRIALADEIKPESFKTIEALHALGVKVAMLTGDNKAVAESVARELNIDTYFAEVLPEDKYKHVKKLQVGDTIVLMVGDGVNDAPALTQADAGIAMGAGTDVAVEAGDVILTRSNPADVVRLLILSRKVYSKMIQNLLWALGYNVIAIPAAAGVFAVWGFFLRPEIGALVMSLSTVVVVINALLLKRVNLEYVA